MSWQLAYVIGISKAPMTPPHDSFDMYQYVNMLLDILHYLQVQFIVYINLQYS